MRGKGAAQAVCAPCVGATARPPHVSGPRRGPVRTRALLTSSPQHLLGLEGCGARLRVPCGRDPAFRAISSLSIPSGFCRGSDFPPK